MGNLNNKLEGKLDEKLVKFIEETINKGKYIHKNIQISEATGNDYFYFYKGIIFAKPNIELPKNIVIPSNYGNEPVVCIGKNAFSNSENRIIRNQNIETVTIPETIMTILDEAFKDCTSLRKVTIYGDRVAVLGKDVFLNTSKDLVIYVPVKMVDEYKKDSSWSVYKDKITASDIPSPEETPNQNGIVNTVVTAIVDSKEVSVSYNFYFLNINNSSVNSSDDVNNSDNVDVSDNIEV
ncbi:leucine-rich repeat protein [Clostridium frigidicarnis]|uniref:Leucine rich repeat-containing protein n=1 Tax=Clostridium frigidicarnis TaxID=84698 RepID=A0A1I1ATD1_9CLOT|nr:leucine-rich repeat protein [Clostridium frigidicarnis]SFB39718.1 Leucine rich repeat-containing protein [Clostridium frigidicarnis]